MHNGAELMGSSKADMRRPRKYSKDSSPARKRYERDLLRFTVAYAVVVFCSAWFVRHDGAERFYFLFWSVIPAIPILSVMVRMGRYLREEKDDSQRMLAMQAILVGTATLMGTLVVNELVKPFTRTQVFPAFVSFLLFIVGTGITQRLQGLRDRVPDSD